MNHDRLIEEARGIIEGDKMCPGCEDDDKEHLKSCPHHENNMGDGGDDDEMDESTSEDGAHLSEAEEVPLSTIAPGLIKWAKKFGTPTTAFEGVHGQIIMLKPKGMGSGRLSRKLLQDLLAQDSLRWVEAGDKRWSIGVEA